MHLALLLVLALTATAGWLGSRLSGLLAPFPVVASVLAVFTHAQRGADEFLRLARGLIAGFFAFALFCFTLSISLRALGIAGAFALATGVAALVQGLLLTLATRALARPREGMGTSVPGPYPLRRPPPVTGPRPIAAPGDRTRAFPG